MSAPLPDLHGQDRVWAYAVVASREAAQRDRDVALREVKRLREALREIRGHSGGDPIRIENIIDDALGGRP